MNDEEIKIIIDLVDVDQEERDLIREIKGKNSAQAAVLIKGYLIEKLTKLNTDYILLLREKARKGIDIKKDELKNDVMGDVGMARNDTLLRRIRIGENEKNKKDFLINLIKILVIGVIISSLLPAMYYFKLLSRPVSVALYLMVLMGLGVYFYYGIIMMTHEKNPANVNERLFRHPNMKMIFQSKILSDMEDVDQKIDELESLVKTVEIPPNMMKQYIDQK
jgi:hypothetical protein